MRKITLIAVLLLFSVVLSGCITISAYHKINRDGSQNMSLSFEGDKSVMALLKKPLEKEVNNQSSLFYGFEILEDEKKITIHKLMTREQIKEFLKKEEESKTAGFSMPSDKFTKETQFPYVYYTIDYTIKASVSSSNMTKQQQQIAQIFSKWDYTIEPFGEIVETNGKRVKDKNAATFTIDSMKDNSIRLKFRDYVWNAYFGENGTMIVGAIAAVIIVLIYLLFLRKKEPSVA